MSTIYTKNCHSCVPPEKDADRMLLSGDNWSAVLRRDHHGAKGWLYRLVIYTREHYTDSREVPDHIVLELQRVRNIFKETFERIYGQMRENFAEAGNLNKDENNKPTSNPLYHHHHYHQFFRHETPISFAGNTYKDHTFGTPFTLDPKPTGAAPDLLPDLKERINVPLDPKQITEIKEIFQLELVRMVFDDRVNARYKPTWKEIRDAFPSKAVIDLYENKGVSVNEKSTKIQRQMFSGDSTQKKIELEEHKS